MFDTWEKRKKGKKMQSEKYNQSNGNFSPYCSYKRDQCLIYVIKKINRKLCKEVADCIIKLEREGANF